MHNEIWQTWGRIQAVAAETARKAGMVVLASEASRRAAAKKGTVGK